MAPTSLITSLFLLLAIPVCLEALPSKLKKSNMVFYMQDWETGKNISAIPIAGPTDKPWHILTFGTVLAIDDALTTTIDRNSPEIGRAQGLYINCALDGSDLHLLLSLIFTSGKYNGSTLEIQGADRAFFKYREVSVVSGTGMFRFARGYAILDTAFVDVPNRNAIVRFNLTVLHY